MGKRRKGRKDREGVPDGPPEQGQHAAPPAPAAGEPADPGATRSAAAPPPARNEVLLVGRVPALPEERELPSGDLLASWRLVVDRPAPLLPRPGGGRAPSVDTLDCVAWEAGVRRQAHALVPGDVVQVVGSLRRRFWRAGAGAASRYEVEVADVRRLVPSAPSDPP